MNRKQTREHINTHIRKLIAENKINYSVVPELVLFIEEAFESWEKSMTEELIVKVDVLVVPVPHPLVTIHLY